jgi:Zn-dependent peptidase ImmA (M78 family)/transcriptional regulator with XRE-family HTH domain
MEQNRFDKAAGDRAKLNGEMFRLGRQLRGFTQKELAETLGVEPSTLSRIENGVAQPSAEIAELASAKLSLPLAFFQQPERPYGLPVSVHPMWRSKAAVSQHSIDQALAELNLRIIHIRRLIRAVEYEPVLALPEVDIEQYRGNAEAVAAHVRRTWMMPAGPVLDLVQWVERAGCFVMQTELPDAAMSGVTLRVPDMRPCIFLNKEMPADRMRFTLAHELGHLVMHRYPSENMEREANSFAAAFLMPAGDIHQYFSGKKIDLRLLAALKPEWRVAMQSLLYRAATLGYLDSNQERYLWQQFSMKKMRMREPAELDIEPERPSLVAKLFALHMNELQYSIEDMAKIAAVYEAELVRLYGIGEQTSTKPRLRLIR